MFVQFLGGIFATILLKVQLTSAMELKLLDKGPLGVPTPDKEVTAMQACIIETIAVIFIHLVRMAVMIDNAGHKVTKIDFRT